MAKKKKTLNVIPLEVDKVYVLPDEATKEIVEKLQPKTPDLNRGESVRVMNAGDPFPVDLSAYGYGYKWPTNAVYTIPMHVYLDCLKRGMNGAQV